MSRYENNIKMCVTERCENGQETLAVVKRVMNLQAL
jgi:hypothetical protein